MGPMEKALSDLYRQCGDLIMSLENATLPTPVMGKAAFEQIKHTLNTFRERFKARETDAIQRCYEALNDPLARLDIFFQNISGNSIDIEERQIALYVARSLDQEITQLRDVARQVDDTNRAEWEVPQTDSDDQQVIDMGHLRIILPSRPETP